MKSLVICIIICSLSNTLFGQSNSVLKQAYTEIGLVEFVEEIERNSDVTFFYKNEWVDSIVFADIKANMTFKEVLDTELIKYGLNYYSSGNQIFIYPGSVIVSEVPEYEKMQVLGREALGNNNTGSGTDNKFIQTRGELTEQLIVIGNKQNTDYSKKCVVKGRIINQRDNERMIGATIFIKELDIGMITDVFGDFELRVFPGEYGISVNHISMKEMHYVLHVFTDGELLIELEDEIIELQEITISHDRFDNVKSMQMGFNRISIKSMKEIPVVMGEKDVIKVAQMLPGVQNVGEGSSGFNVRGGSADQNMFYINKISVYNTSHLFGFFTAFSPDIINDFTLYKNNIPTKYGGRIASVFEISTRNGNKNNFFAQGGISPITGHFSFEGPIIKEKVSVVASYRSTYSDWLLKRMKDTNIRESEASFHDGTLGINSEINKNNQVKVFFYRSSDEFSLSSINDYSYSNTGASLTWKHNYSPTLSSDISFASSNYQFSNTNKNNISEAYSQAYDIRHNEFRADFLLLQYENHRIEFGTNSILYDLNRGDILPFGEESTRTSIKLGEEQGLENAIYISDEFKLLPKLDIMAGLRYSFYSQLGPKEVIKYFDGMPLAIDNVTGVSTYDRGKIVKWHSGLEPRLGLNYLIKTNSSIKASYNRLQQYIFLLSNTIAVSPNDQWKLTDYHIEPPVSDQLSLGYYQDIKNRGISFSIELYKKWINNVVDYKNGADFISNVPIEQQIIQGKQNSNGVEFMLEKTSRNLTGWLSYTYSRSFLKMNGIHAVERINNGIAYPSNFDRPHSMNFVSNYRVNRRLSFSSNVVYSSGRPVTLPVSIYYSQGQQLLLYSDRNQYRIPDYFRVDLSINLEGNLKFQKFGHSYWMFNVYNLTGRTNAYSVFYKAENGKINGYKLSIFARPIVTLSWHLKLGNYSND
ncbi:MAG: TonB-dependent receptor [Bacteroidales bacterium]|nr:TonB-dependent receptor [Bacteroidales bacterium]